MNKPEIYIEKVEPSIDELKNENASLRRQLEQAMKGTTQTRADAVAATWEMSIDMAEMEKQNRVLRQSVSGMSKGIDVMASEMAMLAYESRLPDHFSLAAVPGLKTIINGVELESSGTTWGRVDIELSNR